MNLLYTMLVNKSSESEDDTMKVLDYFKNQFTNIRGHASSDTQVSVVQQQPWSSGMPPPSAPPVLERQLSEKEVTARACITKCATDCLSEVVRSLAAMLGKGDAASESTSAAAAAASSAGVPEPLSDLPPVGQTALARAGSSSAGGADPEEEAALEDDELRSRATQAAALLIIVLDLVENMRPDVLRELHSGFASPLAMVQVVKFLLLLSLLLLLVVLLLLLLLLLYCCCCYLSHPPPSL